MRRCYRKRNRVPSGTAYVTVPSTTSVHIGDTMLTTDDRSQITEVLALHAYVADEDLFDRMPDIFTADAVYDMSGSGMGSFQGIDTIKDAAMRMAASGHAPRAHFVTNMRITSTDDYTASARSRGLMIMADGSVHGVTYDDTLRRENGDWRIARRIITPLEARSSTAVPATESGH